MIGRDLWKCSGPANKFGNRIKKIGKGANIKNIDNPFVQFQDFQNKKNYIATEESGNWKRNEKKIGSDTEIGPF